MSLSSKIPQVLISARAAQIMMPWLKVLYNAIEQWDALWRFYFRGAGNEQALTG
jgi:hypothetical protein